MSLIDINILVYLDEVQLDLMFRHCYVEKIGYEFPPKTDKKALIEHYSQSRFLRIKPSTRHFSFHFPLLYNTTNHKPARIYVDLIEATTMNFLPPGYHPISFPDCHSSYHELALCIIS